MDDLDREILFELERQGFQKRSVAHALGIGERTLRQRINNLLATDAIKVIAVPNPVLDQFRIWSKIGIKVAPSYLGHVARVLVKHPSIYFAAYALGRFDIVIAVHFDSIGKLAHFVNSELIMTKGVVVAETWLLSSPRKYYHFSWPAPVFQKHNNAWSPYSEVAGSETGYELDEVSRGILGILGENGLTQPASLKLRLGIGESTIRKRMRDMLANQVYKLEVVPNPEVLEHESWATIGITVSNQYAHRVIDSITRHQAVYLASGALGRFNVIVACRFSDSDSLNRFVTEDIRLIPGISSTETFIHNKPLKYHNVNWLRTIINYGR